MPQGVALLCYAVKATAQGLLEHDLLDELRLMVYPVVLGKGKRLFGSTTTKKRMRLRSSTVVGDGVGILFYEACGRRDALVDVVREAQGILAGLSLTPVPLSLTGEGKDL